MLVDDDHAIRDMLELVLEDAGFGVVVAPNGAEALALLRATAEAPCAILRDLNMPVMTGWEFRAAQQQDAALLHIPVVQSAERDVEVQPPVVAAGYFRKPLNLPRLLGTLATFCS